MTLRPTPALTRDDVLRLCGDLPRWKVSAILDSGATIDDLETAMSWAVGEIDTDSGPELKGSPAIVYDILTASEGA